MEYLLPKLGALGMLLGMWWGMVWFHISLHRRAQLRQLITLRFRTCARLQLPMVEALSHSAAAPKNVRRVMDETSEHMREGQTLSQALDGHWAFIPAWYTRVLAIGEDTGNMAGALDLLHETDERAEEKRLSYFDQLFYPFSLLMTLCTALEVILIFLAPTFLSNFKEMGINETPLHSVFIHLADILVPLTPFIGLAFIVIMITIMPFQWGPRVDRYFPPARWINWLMRRIIPGLGNAYFRAATARWAAMVGLMLDAGMTLPEALEEAKNIETDPSFRKAANRWSDDVHSGKSLGSALSASRFVPQSMIWQIQCAEGESDFPETLRMAGRQEMTKLQKQVGYLFNMLSPVFVVLAGTAVGFVAVCMFQYFTQIMNSLA